MPTLRDLESLIQDNPGASDEELLSLARGARQEQRDPLWKQAWEWGNAPLVDLADDAFGESALGRFGVSMAEAMTSPLSVAGLALTGGASAAGKAGLLGLSRGARAAEAALNVPYLAEGLSTLAGAKDWGTAAGGGVEAALAGWGLKGAMRRPTSAGTALVDGRLWKDERGSFPLGNQGEPDLPYEEMVAETLEGGGASRFLDGRSPSSGAMVGGVAPPETVKHLTPEALAQFALKHRAALDAAPNRTLGAFADKGAFDLDVSENVGGLEEALELARARGEKSVFDLGTYQTYPNPAHPDTATYWQELQHRSKTRGLTAIDPEFQGRGQAGDERARRGAWPRDYVARTFWNTPESVVEGNIAKLPQQYTGFARKADLLDQADPLYTELEERAFRIAAERGDPSEPHVQTILERLIKDHVKEDGAGFAGVKLTETLNPEFTKPVDPEWLLAQTILPQSPMEREPYVSLTRAARFMRQPTSSANPLMRQEVQTFGTRPVLPESVIRRLREAEARDAGVAARAVGDSGPTAPSTGQSQSATTPTGSAGSSASGGRVTQEAALKAASDTARRGAPALLAAPAALDEDGEVDPITAALAAAGLGVAGASIIRKRGVSGTTLRNAQRIRFPGIYKDPRDIVAEAAARVVPESPALRRIFGTSREELAEIGRTRRSIAEPPIQFSDRGRGSDAARRVITPQNTDRLVTTLALAGEVPGLAAMDGWYVMDPAYRKLAAAVGEPEARRLYSRWNTLTGMASPGTPVLDELNRGSAANYYAQQGDFATFLAQGGGALPDVVGHPYHSTAQAAPMAKYLSSGQIESDAAKVPAYVSASALPDLLVGPDGSITLDTLQGMQSHVPVGDAHYARAVGLADARTGAGEKGWVKSISVPELATLLPWWQRDIARPLGLESVPAQARLWGAFSPQTGVDSPVGAPKLELFAMMVEQTARRLGISEDQAVIEVLKGQRYLLPYQK